MKTMKTMKSERVLSRQSLRIWNLVKRLWVVLETKIRSIHKKYLKRSGGVSNVNSALP